MASKGDGSRNRGGGRRDSNPGAMGGGGRSNGGDRDTSGAQGGGLGRSRGGLVGESDTAKRNRDRTGFADPSRKEKPGNAFGGWLQKAMSLIPGLPGSLMAGGMLVGDLMGDDVQRLQEDVDAGRIKSKRADDAQMGRVDIVGGKPNSFGNAATDDRVQNANDLGRGMTGGAGADSNAAAQAAEERRKRRLAAQQTALGSEPESKLGPGVLPI